MCALVAGISHRIDNLRDAASRRQSASRRPHTSCGALVFALVCGSSIAGCAKGQPIADTEVVQLNPARMTAGDAGADAAPSVDDMDPPPAVSEMDASAGPPQTPVTPPPPAPVVDAGALDAAASDAGT